MKQKVDSIRKAKEDNLWNTSNTFAQPRRQQPPHRAHKSKRTPAGLPPVIILKYRDQTLRIIGAAGVRSE